MSSTISWKKSFPLFIAFAGFMLAAPAHAGVLDDLRQVRTQAEKQDAKKQRNKSPRKRRVIEQAPQDEQSQEEASGGNEQPRFAVQPTGPRGLRRMTPHAEPAAFQTQEEDRWAQRRGWYTLDDQTAEHPAKPETQLASVESEQETLPADPTATTHQYWDENNEGWTDTQEGTRPIPRQEVEYQTKETPGTIVINTTERRLYFVMGNGMAMQYGIGVGREGFEWNGVKQVTRKEEWPDWRPPEMMIKRRPDLPRYMPGGPTNPMGARAMYLGSTLYRIHGSNEPESIGQAVSSGCIRMINADVIDLYNRVKVGTKVVVR